MNINGVSKNTLGSSNVRQADGWVAVAAHVLTYGVVGGGQVNKLLFGETERQMYGRNTRGNRELLARLRFLFQQGGRRMDG